MQFKSLDSADVGTVFKILKDVYGSSQFPMGGAWSEVLLDGEITRTSSLALWVKSQLVAFVIYRRDATIWEITVLATSTEHRRQGYMQQLLRHLLASKPRDVELWLEVHEKNLPALNLYKKLGFHQVGRRQGYYRDGAAALLLSCT